MYMKRNIPSMTEVEAKAGSALLVAKDGADGGAGTELNVSSSNPPNKSTSGTGAGAGAGGGADALR